MLRAGAAVEIRDAAGMAAAISAFLGDPAQRQRAAQAGADGLACLRCPAAAQRHRAAELAANVDRLDDVRAGFRDDDADRFDLVDAGVGRVEGARHFVEANLALGYKADPRDYGVGLQILKDLGLSRVRLLTNNPKKTDAFVYGGFDLTVVDQVPIMPPIQIADPAAGLFAATAQPPAAVTSTIAKRASVFMMTSSMVTRRVSTGPAEGWLYRS